MNILKPKVKETQQKQPLQNINFDEIIDLLSQPAPIQVQLVKNQKDLNEEYEIVQLQDVLSTIEKYTRLGSENLIKNNLKDGIDSLR